jgi:hypothetical protein
MHSSRLGTICSAESSNEQRSAFTMTSARTSPEADTMAPMHARSSLISLAHAKKAPGWKHFKPISKLDNPCRTHVSPLGRVSIHLSVYLFALARSNTSILHVGRTLVTSPPPLCSLSLASLSYVAYTLHARYAG